MGPVEWNCNCSAAKRQERVNGGATNATDTTFFAASSSFVILCNSAGDNRPVPQSDIVVGTNSFVVIGAIEHFSAIPSSPAAGGHYVAHVRSSRGWATVNDSVTSYNGPGSEVSGMILLAIDRNEVESGDLDMWKHLQERRPLLAHCRNEDTAVAGHHVLDEGDDSLCSSFSDADDAAGVGTH